MVGLHELERMQCISISEGVREVGPHLKCVLTLQSTQVQLLISKQAADICNSNSS